MSKTFSVTTSIQLLGEGFDVSIRTYRAVALTSESIKHGSEPIAATTTLDLWDSSQTPTSFTALALVTDGVAYAEFTTDRGAEVGTEVYTVALAADAPLVLCADDSYANYTADFAGGTLDVIDRIRVRNISGATVTLRYIIAN